MHLPIVKMQSSVKVNGSHSWKCSRSVWIWLWGTWCSGRELEWDDLPAQTSLILCSGERIAGRSGLVASSCWNNFDYNLSLGLCVLQVKHHLHSLKFLGIRYIYRLHKTRDHAIRCIHSIRCGKYVVIKILGFPLLVLFL